MNARRANDVAAAWLARLDVPADHRLADAVADVVDTLAERPYAIAGALRRFGEALGADGWPMHLVMDHVVALHPLLRRRHRKRLRSLQVVGSLAEGWAAGYVRGAHTGTCIDPITGLATAVVLRVRLREVEAQCRTAGTTAASAYCVVLIDLDTQGLDVLDADLLMACAADMTTSVFAAGETVARVGQRLVVLAPVSEHTLTRVDIVRDRLVLHSTTHRGSPTVVVDHLPAGVAPERYLTDLLA
ncbi:MAG TPA: hypothetical protein DCR14_20210 [Acidimicrobiaceae bacterium]|nr:hypothetical protein [Acidimicrobiaceae bacterium]